MSTTPSTDLQWMRDATCRDTTVDMTPARFHHEAVAQAQAVCTTGTAAAPGPCPVLETCLNWAIEARVTEGVWGGKDIEEIEARGRRMRRAAATRRSIEAREQTAVSA
jgi:hypothetical protein